MKRILLALPLLLIAPTPASATGGLVCRTAGSRPVDLSLVVGHTAVSTIVSVRLTDAGRIIPATIAQSWLDPNEIRLDLVNGNATRHLVRLRAIKAGSAYDGTLWRNGKRRWVRCREG